MKRALLICSLLAVTGCANIDNLVDAYLMKYDVNEYKLINDIRTTAQLEQLNCNHAEQAKKAANTIAVKTLTLQNYAEFQRHNKPIQQSTIELNKIAQGLAERYNSNDPVNPEFCKIKFKMIEGSAKIIQESEGGKPK